MKNVSLPTRRIKLGVFLQSMAWFRSQLHYQLSQTIRTLMAVLTYTTAFCTLIWMNIGIFRLIKIYSEVPEVSVFISNKYRFNRCWHCWDTSMTVRQTETTFQLYIVDRFAFWNQWRHECENRNISWCMYFITLLLCNSARKSSKAI